jgi:exonuclease SbcD
MLRLIQDALSDGPARQIFLRGNHDAETARESKVSVLAEMGPGWSATSSAGLAVVGDVVVATMGYLDRHWLRTQPGFESAPDADVYRILAEQFLTIARGLYASAKRAHPHLPCVLVCHQTLSGAAMSDTQRAFLGDVSLVVDSSALSAIGFEAVVAGHLHRHQVVVPGERPVLYAGSIERVDFGEERDPKGFIVADVGPGRFEWELVSTPARRFVTLDGPDPWDQDVAGAIVRVRNLPIDVSPSAVAELRHVLERAGAFEITSIERVPRELTAPTGGMSEALAPTQALEAYFAADPDAPVLIERGRELLAEVA